MSFIVTPKILLPVSSINKEKWAVIACDQFTSEPEYWDELKTLVDNVPSTYHLILPEAYLDDEPVHRVEKINYNMDLYLKNNLFEEHEAFILVERQTPHVKKRLGLVIAIDLEEYQYEEGKIGKIKATEKTVPERIPPRVKIREKAPIELPHVLVLMDDLNESIITNLYKNKNKLEKLYDFKLNMDGGHLRGYKVTNTSEIIQQIENLSDDLNLIVGDGNHSLASAKVCWENIKKELPESEWSNHPARYALVELISLYDDGLTFEPIHRVLFNADINVIKTLENNLSGNALLDIYYQNNVYKINVPENPFNAIKEIQVILDEYISRNKYIEIDFVHGMDSLKKIVKNNKDSVGITMPALKREMLLPYIRENGVLPRKSFSLGEAVEKRYYMESKKILK
ncbi:MAG: DUF1015 domain-containing protein [Candidatus Izemoplasmatales bacterium]|uniref:DUF1015 domain-containing protein n=1 Tax=Hujiaoplasma nucleasis TaxID=2725268 RepID=A0A7L6MZU7_9MOLU|nr:DUF1015 domain-containing protein [Hujiaoplasma nucleasis]QLY39526.1 DUF1015 domain-containing protein [Hujiaoplasma nucleasis]